ncbi:MAG: response regulator [Thermostichales cyanobacterium BF4_bins_65]
MAPVSHTPPKEQSPYRVLNEMGAKRVGGTVTFRDPLDLSVGWSVFLSADHVLYATATAGQLPRLTYVLSRINPSLVEVLGGIREKELEYGWLVQQLSQRLGIRELRQVVMRMTQEALIHLLAIPRAPLQYSRATPISSPLLTHSWAEVSQPLAKAVERWASLRETFPAPLTRLSLDPRRMQEFCHHWDRSQASRYFPRQGLPGCMALLSQSLTLYELCAQMGCDPFTMAAWSRPLVDQGVLRVGPYESPSVERPLVACIDDSKTVQKQVKGILEVAGFAVLGITEPGQALTALVRQKPALILMDVNMPEIDGYELCRMLRQSKQLKEIPIVMLTGRDGLLDRLRAQILGVTDYVTKPFQPEQLLTAVQKAVPSQAP